MTSQLIQQLRRAGATIEDADTATLMLEASNALEYMACALERLQATIDGAAAEGRAVSEIVAILDRRIQDAL